MRDKPNEWVSIADLMAGVVGVVILFFVAIAVLQRNAETATPSEGAVAREARTEILKALATRLQQVPNGQAIEVFRGYDVVGLPSGGMFGSGEIRLSPRGVVIAETLLTTLSEILPCYAANADANVRCSDTVPRRAGCVAPAPCVPPTHRPIFEAVLIEGHADAMLSVGNCDNWCLSTARAKAVFDIARLRSQYRPLMDLRNSNGQPLFGLAGYGASRPRQGVNYPADDPRQRRIEIRFVLSPLPDRTTPTGPSNGVSPRPE